MPRGFTPPMAGRWEREYFQPESGDATLRYVVFGDLTPDMNVDASAYRTSGAPTGIKMELFNREAHGKRIEGWTDRYYGVLLEEQPELEKAVRAAPTVALLQGEVEDPETLDYLRDTIGVVTALLDAGGVGVLDAVALRWWTPEEWREAIFDPAGPEPIEQITLLAAAEIGGYWLHSRGMRKFGRPDLSAHGLAQEDLETFAALFESLAVTLAGGATIPDGQRIRFAGTKIERMVTLQGNPDDPEFDNVHYELA